MSWTADVAPLSRVHLGQACHEAASYFDLFWFSSVVTLIKEFDVASRCSGRALPKAARSRLFGMFPREDLRFLSLGGLYE